MAATISFPGFTPGSNGPYPNQAKGPIKKVAAHRKAQAHDEAVVLAPQLEKVVLHLAVKVGEMASSSVPLLPRM